MKRRGSMRCKGLFWLGMALSLAGAASIVFGTTDAGLHGMGILLVILGAIVAVRNCRL